MFKLFGKKKEAPKSDASSAQHPELAALAAQFDPEEFDILAVTGANGFGGDKEPGQELWTATLPLTAWKEDGGPLHREDTCLVALADDTLLGYLRRLAPRDSIIPARVRQGLDDDRFLLVGMPSPVMDPELKAILEEQKQEVSTWVPGLGTFVLNRSVNWFQADVDWLGQSIQLTYDQGSEAEMKAAQDNALALMADQAGWDGKVRAFAADRLLSQANDWVREAAGEDGEAGEVTRESFLEQMELESVQIYGDGRFEFWFNDGGLFWGRAIHVTGSLTEGPADAQMEG